MIKRGKHGIIKLLSLCLTIAVLCTMIPAFTASAVPITNAPMVKSYSVSPSSIEKGEQFSMDLTFQHYIKASERNLFDKVFIKTKNVKGLDRAINDKTFLAFPEDIEETGTETESKAANPEYIGIQYDLHIPEEVLKYTGSDGATIKFEITYFKEMQEGK